jgi:Protein of unknown function (DUF3891)
MVIRELKNGSSIISTQEDHAELSAQFAAHWGNKKFARLRPYETMVFATTYHDSGYREWEGNPPMNVTKGRPYAHREEIPSFEPVELRAYARNVEWVSSQDRYAGLLVSMHRTGLWQNRYDTFTSPKGRLRERSPEVKVVKQQLETKQEEEKKSLGRENPSSKTICGSTIERCRSMISCRFISAVTDTSTMSISKKSAWRRFAYPMIATPKLNCASCLPASAR